jgi:radical SAM superfamily enzyme YgiQ (UPF0313 family)
MLGKEVCLVDRPPKSGAGFGVSWFYPNTYAVGMSGLGYQLVWWLLEQDPQTLVTRGFTDKEEGGAEAGELFGFTLSWELDFINILKILDKHGIDALATERNDDDPLVFGGGPVLSANPEPFADFFDVILLGDAESIVPQFLEAWKEARQLDSREKRLLHLSTISGVYVPRYYKYTVQTAGGPLLSIEPTIEGLPKRLTKQLFTAPPDYLAHSVMLSRDTAWGDMFLVELVRSCPQECRFCLASFLTRPFRAAKVDAVMQAIDLGLKYTKKIGLLGPSVTEHPQFDQIAQALLERPQTDISIASIRADTVSEPVLNMLRRLGQKSVTIAIESGSERLRSIMKKNLCEAEIDQAVALIASHGFESVKLYGMVGLPHEEQADLEETIRLLTKLKKTHRQLRIVFGVSSFVPKAQTPFQWWGRDKKAGEKLEYLRKHLAKLGIDVRPESHNWSDVQALLSRGDRRLTEVLLQVFAQGSTIGAWKRACKKNADHLPDLDYYAFRQIPTDEFLPWSHLTEPEKTEYLNKHLVAAQSLAQD